VIITRHAVERYRAVLMALRFGASMVRLGNGAGLVLDGDRVVTVVGKHQLSRNTLPSLP
jgi:hypothetical protein